MNRFASGAAALIITLGLPCLAAAAEFTVDTLADDASAPDDNPGDDICADALGACTLRAAIEEANADGTSDDIEFGVTGTITVSDAVGPMPALGETVFIEGPTTGSPGNRPGDSPPAVTLDGAALSGGGNDHGLRFLAGAAGSNLTSLAIVNFPDNGIQIDGANVLVDGCFIGVKPDGTAAGNGGAGISGIASDSIIGKFAFGDALAGIGNVISSNGGDGIVLLGGNNILAGNFIGVDPDGVIERANAANGLEIAGAGNIIGIGQFEHAENVVSGNDGHGMLVGGSQAEITGNRIGVSKVGNAMGNNQHGLILVGDDHVVGSTQPYGTNHIANNETGIVVGTDTNAADNNVIVNNDLGISALNQGNFADGISIENAAGTLVSGNQVINNNGSGIRVTDGAEQTTIRSNTVGFVDGATGVEDHSNGFFGIVTSGLDTMIGGMDPGQGNILGFDGTGIFLAELSAEVHGNHVGVTPGGDPMGHINYGIFVSLDSNFNTIGSQQAPNVIGASDWYGIYVESDGNGITHNYIGTNPDNADLGNTTSGIRLAVSAVDNLVLENIIAYNGTSGVEVIEEATSNSIIENAMYENDLLGIDLAADGIAINDPGDGDTGPNRMMNHPEITIVGYDQVNARIMIEMSVDTADANATYPLRIDYYWHDRNESNQGRQYIGAVLYDIPQSVVSEDFFLPLGTTGGTLRATATDESGAGSTSELSPEHMFGFFDFIFADGFEGS